MLSVAAIGGCLAFVLNALISLHLPSLVNAVRNGLRVPATSPPPTSRAVPKANTRSGLPELPAAIGASSDAGAVTPPQAGARQTPTPMHSTPRTAAEHHRPHAPDQQRAAAHEAHEAHEAHTPAAAKSRPRPRGRTVPAVKDNAMASSQPADHHDSASTPTAFERRRQRSGPTQSREPPIADIRLSRPEADRLLARFLRAYEVGSITNFMQLFAEQARTGYRPEYVQLFANTTTRRINFYDFRWQLLGSNGTGEGQFVVTAQRTGETTPSIIRGRLLLQIRKSRQGVLITELFHTHR